MKINIISNKFKLLWQLRCTVICILIIIAAMLISLSKLIAIIAVALIGIVYLAIILWLIPVYYKKLDIGIINNKLIIKRGIFFNKHICMSYDKIQCIKQIITPLNKLTDSCDCIFYFTTNSIYLSGINANILQTFIK